MKTIEIRKGGWMVRTKWTALIVTLFISVGCGGGALTSEQLQELEEAKNAALVVEEKIQQQKATRKELNEDLATKRTELKQLRADKSVLMERLRKLEQLNRDEAESDTSTAENDDGK